MAPCKIANTKACGKRYERNRLRNGLGLVLVVVHKYEAVDGVCEIV
jgi:hypothetical protein